MKKPTTFLLVFFTLLSSSLCFGQEFSISGFIDDAQGDAVPYASILVMKAQDSTVVNGVSSNEEGFFLVKELPTDSYVLKVSFLGFNDVYRTVDLSESVDLGTIVLEENTETLDEINIIAKRPTLTKQPDRMVFNIENTALIEGSMFQAIKSTPGVLVLDGNILVKNTTPTVYINDKKVHLSNEELTQLLEGSSANSIKSIEVITNPSARYDAESGAVINIVMSKNLATGYRGNVFANYTQGVFPRYQAGTGHFFKSEKINFFGNYSFSDDKINRDQNDQINYLNADGSVDQIFKSNIGRNTRSQTHNFIFNLDYAVNERNTLSLSSNMLFLPYFNYRINNITDVFDATNTQDYYIRANNMSDDAKYNLGFDIDYVHQFKKPGNRLSANAHYTSYNYNRDQNVSSDYFEPDNTFLFDTAYRTDNTQNTDIFTAQVDFNLPIGKANLEMGLKNSNVKNQSDIAQFDIISGEEVIDTNNTNVFDYDENVFAGYINYSQDWEKLSLVAGIRAEQTNITGVSVMDNVINKQDYLEWFPNASISYTFSDNVSLYSSYKRSIKRPDYQSLNPFRFFLNDFTVVVGNPLLRPVFVDHAVIGTTIFKRFTIESYFKVNGDNIFELPRQDNENNIINYSVLNLDKTREYGFDFATYFDVASNWSVYFVSSFYNTKGEGEFDGSEISLDLWSNYTEMSNDFSLLKDKSLNVNFILVYTSRFLHGLQELDGSLISELALSKTVLKNRGIISLSIADLFNTQDYGITNRYLNQSSESFSDLDNRYIKLGFRYKFGNTNLTTNQRTKAQQETERLEKNDN